ncbi:MAG TPA: tyrosine-type recombinase/integrase [Alcaligenes phenolicus]|uniref:tyrosine-type recombinase/integrase n=1 Tax=Alcaligenes phenolicus TaxID=232846 RepID=UPI002CBB4D6C|nr:tyrosine-type recombinase/integrase [Alcaligenes phenolicus]HRO22612.1 tyrosine-type recombinase/integrase [Alcaligenes phenolicus]
MDQSDFSTKNLPVKPDSSTRILDLAEFQQLSEIPFELEWYANLDNENTRRTYKNALQDFMQFTGIQKPEEFRQVTRAHIIAFRDELKRRDLSGSSIRNKLAAISSLFEYLCDKNAVTHNPVKGTKRPAVESYEGKSPALGDHQARALLDAPDSQSLKGKRDRAILAILLYHALRRDELCKLKVKDVQQERRGVLHMKVSGKGGKTRYLPIHPVVSRLIHEYLEVADHGREESGPLFKSLSNNRNMSKTAALTADAVYKIVQCYSDNLGFRVGAHSLRATAATNALENNADIAKVQEWLGHANISTTRIYDHRKMRPEDSPTFKVSY